MGECGCGEMQLYKTVKVGNYILCVEIYPGCKYCSTGLIVTLHLFTEEEAKSYFIGVDQAKIFSPNEYGHEQLDFPIIGPEDIQLWLDRLDNKEPSIISQYSNIRDFISDWGLEMLQGGLHIRLAAVEEKK